MLCHGLGANSKCLDFDGDEQGKDWKKYSLAYYLLQDKKIFDVWVIDLRGSKKSQKIFHPRKISFPVRWIKLLEAIGLIDKLKENVGL
ncbi:MAG: hypothetical protein QXW78_02060 [Candidatus Thermoplasmatota archaeon]